MPVNKLIQEAAELWERLLKDRAPASDSELKQIVGNPRLLSAYKRVVSDMIRIRSWSIDEDAKVKRARAGARARSEKLTPEQRSAIAQKAGRKGAAARWGKKSPEEGD